MTCAEVENVAQPGARWRKWDWLRWRSEERTINAVDLVRREIDFTCDGNQHRLPVADWGRWIAGAQLVYSPPRMLTPPVPPEEIERNTRHARAITIACLRDADVSDV